MWGNQHVTNMKKYYQRREMVGTMHDVRPREANYRRDKTPTEQRQKIQHTEK
jgi:hypothetical protein